MSISNDSMAMRRACSAPKGIKDEESLTAVRRDPPGSF
jgi:hypothetical protein